MMYMIIHSNKHFSYSARLPCAIRGALVVLRKGNHVGKYCEKRKQRVERYGLNYLNETNIKGSLSEALTAHVNVVLSDDGRRVG